MKTPEMLEATHKRHMENWRAEVDEDLLDRDHKRLQDVKKRFEGCAPLPADFGHFPRAGIEKLA